MYIYLKGRKKSGRIGDRKGKGKEEEERGEKEKSEKQMFLPADLQH